MLTLTLDSIRLFLHVLAATLWVGGQLTLVALLPVLRAAGGAIPARAARAFNRVAWPAYAVLVATGIWNVAAEWDGASAAWHATVWAKAGVVAVSGATAALHLRARNRGWLAVWGAASGLSAIAALFLGVLLGSSGH